jgi:transcriptional regulator with XRE-family HTH domain
LTAELPRIKVSTSRSSLSDVRDMGPCSGTHPLHTTMATMMAPVEQREVLRCDHCSLVQFRTVSSMCRKCHKPLDVEEPEPVALPALSLVPPAAPSEIGGLQVATAVRDLRRVRNLSQRQLAGRMNVPRTYISKIENGKAMPTLGSLERLARALQVDISALLRDAKTRHKDEAAVLMTDPFLAEIAQFCGQLDALQKSIFLNHVRELAAGRRRMA